MANMASKTAKEHKNQRVGKVRPTQTNTHAHTQTQPHTDIQTRTYAWPRKIEYNIKCRNRESARLHGKCLLYPVAIK